MTDNINEQFVRAWTPIQPDVYRYVRALVPSDADAQDVLQETAVSLLNKFEEYDRSEPFAPWACRFARFEVLKYRRKTTQQNRGRVWSDEVLQQLESERAEYAQVLEQRHRALADCLEKLPAEHRGLVDERYIYRTPLKQVAERTGVSIHTIYKRLEKIRSILLTCVNHAIAALES